LLAAVGLSSDQLWLISVNGKCATVESQLHDGDRVELVPPVGGG
jgi:sulfur carrier protein ThiS